MSFMKSLPRPVATYHTTTYPNISESHTFTGQGKTILITGGANGIGLSIAQSFAAAGVARIIIVSRSTGPQEEVTRQLKAGYPTLKVTTHAASIKDHTRMDEIIRTAGPIDVLVLNAAVAHRRAPAADISLEEMQDALETNTTATFNIAKAYLSSPASPSGKTIISVSAAVVQMINPYRAAYGASKAASVYILQSLASQYRQAGNGDVRIHSYHPGSLYTPGVAENIPKNAPGIEWDDIRLPADFAVWLAGEESRFLDGRFLWANWDVDELLGLKRRVEEDANFLTIGLVQ